MSFTGKWGQVNPEDWQNRASQTYKRVYTALTKSGKWYSISNQANISQVGMCFLKRGQPRSHSVFSKCQLRSWLHMQFLGPTPEGLNENTLG